MALLALALLGGDAWYLVQRSAGGGSGPGAAGGGARGPGGPGGGRAMVKVGQAVATQAPLPVVMEALGTVTKGQLLAQIDARPFEQALLQAQGTRQRDEAQLDNARLTLTRYRTLLAQDSSPARTWTRKPRWCSSCRAR